MYKSAFNCIYAKVLNKYLPTESVTDSGRFARSTLGVCQSKKVLGV